MRRFVAVYLGSHVVSVSVATVGSLVSTTSPWSGATTSLAVIRYTNRPWTVVSTISSPDSMSSRSKKGWP